MELRLDTPLDMHLHLREGEMLTLVAPFSATQFAGGVIMPNLLRPVDSLARMRAYRAAIVRAVQRGNQIMDERKIDHRINAPQQVILRHQRPQRHNLQGSLFR